MYNLIFGRYAEEKFVYKSGVLDGRASGFAIREKILCNLLFLNRSAKDPSQKKNRLPRFFSIIVYLLPHFCGIKSVNSAYRENLAVIYVRILDTIGRIRCMDNLTIAGINGNMAGVAYNIARLHVVRADSISDTAVTR